MPRERALLLLAATVFVLASCAHRVDDRSPQADGPPYEILMVSEIRVRNGDRVLRVTYRAHAKRRRPSVLEAGKHLLPLFVDQLEDGSFDAFAARAQHRTREFAGTYVGEDYTVVFVRDEATGAWGPISPSD